MPRRLENLTVAAAPALFVLFWSSGFIGTKLGLPYAEPLTFLSVRMIGTVLLFAVIVMLTQPKWPSAAGMAHSAVAGILVHGLYLGGMFIAMGNGVSAGLAALVGSLQPILTSTIAARWLGERVLPRQWLGLALGLAGVYLVLREKAALGGATLLALAGAAVGLFAITVGTLYQKRFGGGMDWRSALAVQYTAAAVVPVLGAFAFETRVVHWTPQFLFAACWLVFVLSFGAIWLLYFLIRRAAAARVTSMFYLTPPTTALMAWALFGERLPPLALLGMAVCVAGVALVNWRPAAAAA